MLDSRNREPGFPLRTVLALIGFTAVIAQIVLLRELIVVFNGNEMSLGLMLASWLLWTAAGSGILGGFGKRADPRRLMALIEALIALALPATIVAVRESKNVFESLPGELLGPGPMFLTSLVTLSVFCMLSGWLFAAGSRLFADATGSPTAQATASVYLMEAIGSGAGGIVASLVLIRTLNAMEIAGLLALLNLLAAASLAFRSTSRRRAAVAILLAVFAFLVIPRDGLSLEEYSLRRLWRGFHLVAVRNSIYGNLAIVEESRSRSLFENGLVLFHAPDQAAAEEAVHFALLEHPAPASLLLIGGGVNGSLVQALQHPSLKQVDYVELDPAIFDLATRYFPATPIRSDPRAHLHTVDGRLFLKTNPGVYDVIIVNLPDPQTAQLNRFYTEEFFREAAGRLSLSGLLAIQLTASENYISPEQAELLRCIHNTVRAVFPEVAAIPGDTVHLFGARQAGVLATGPQQLLERLRARHLQTQFVREYFIPFRMSPDRMADLGTQIQPLANTPINRDFTPIAYYFDAILWSTRFNRTWRAVFEPLAHASFSVVIVVAFFAISAVAAFARRRRGGRGVAGLAIATMGFTMMALEILLLLGFQAIYGYVYHQLAILIATFMGGMALGSWWGMRRNGSLGVLQAIAAIAPLALCGLFVAMSSVQSAAGLFVVSQIVFPALALLCGLLGGFQFPVAARIFFAGEAHGAGTLYGLDLAGACLGAVALSGYLVPVFGFVRTALLIAVVNSVPAVGAMFSGRRTPGDFAC